MNIWATFWMLCLIVAGGAFALITLIVMFKGFKDLREMLRELSKKQHEETNPDN